MPTGLPRRSGWTLSTSAARCAFCSASGRTSAERISAATSSDARPAPSIGFLPQMLTPHGYAAYAVGKWHLTPDDEAHLAATRVRWPLARGFERFYGFINGGETHQNSPALVSDNHFVLPPRSVEDGYHLTEDLVDRACEFVTDLRHGKVFDRVTLPCMMAGVLLNTLFAGLTGTGASLAGMATAVGLALVTTLIAGRGLGGGDVKLLAAVGALQGPGFALWTCGFAALAGPFLCLVPLVRSGLLGYTLRNFAHNAVGRFVMGAPVQIVSDISGGTG